MNIYGVPQNLFLRKIFKIIFPKGIGSWVDLGCGEGNLLKDINIIPREGLGVDVLDSKFTYLPCNFLYRRMSIFDFVRDSITKKSKFDLITAFDVVEHIEKNKSLKLLGDLKKIADVVIISTPNGFLKQDADTHPEFKDNPYQWHRCGFTVPDFLNLGFDTFLLKNYHFREFGVFDVIIAIYIRNDHNLLKVAKRKMVVFSLAYNLHPLHLFRTVRSIFKKLIFILSHG